jgi:hypothetical protein
MTERRRTIRNRSYLGGVVTFAEGRSAIECIVRNISGGGAKVVFAGTAIVPDAFDLAVARKERTFRARMVWRRAHEVGVAFAGQDERRP